MHYLQHDLCSYVPHMYHNYAVHNLQIYGDRSDIVLLSISSIIPLWSEIILSMTSIILNQLEFVVWNVLVNVRCALAKNVYSDVIAWHVL